ncbi:hypothetical protein PSENEW3_00005576 [Picochlorum sp. SENEW3]|nr:hypothetical protein PSENEW3_00005576 [Picochlorum sp. SENEW3]
MAKGLRSKIRKHFRTIKRATVSSNPTYQENERAKQDALEEIARAPRPERPDNAMTGDEQMELVGDGEDMGMTELTSKNPAKVARKLRERRLAKLKGQNKGKAKKSNALAGANQFHKKKKKR